MNYPKLISSIYSKFFPAITVASCIILIPSSSDYCFLYDSSPHQQVLKSLIKQIIIRLMGNFASPGPEEAEEDTVEKSKLNHHLINSFF